MIALSGRAAAPVRSAAAVLIAAAALSACGGGGTTTTAAATSTPTGTRSGGRFDAAQFQRIQQCLTAAGISIPTPSGGFRTDRPNGTFTGRPNASGTFTRRPNASGTFTRRPGATGGPGGAFRGMFNDPKVRAALQACGITLPTRPPGGGNGNGGGGGPTSSPTPS